MERVTFAWPSRTPKPLAFLLENLTNAWPSVWKPFWIVTPGYTWPLMTRKWSEAREKGFGNPVLSLAWQESPLGVRGQGTSSTSSLRGFNAFPPPLDSPTTPMVCKYARCAVCSVYWGSEVRGSDFFWVKESWRETLGRESVACRPTSPPSDLLFQRRFFGGFALSLGFWRRGRVPSRNDGLVVAGDMTLKNSSTCYLEAMSLFPVATIGVGTRSPTPARVFGCACPLWVSSVGQPIVIAGTGISI